MELKEDKRPNPEDLIKLIEGVAKAQKEGGVDFEFEIPNVELARRSVDTGISAEEAISLVKLGIATPYEAHALLFPFGSNPRVNPRFLLEEDWDVD